MVSDRIIDLYERHAAAWDHDRGRDRPKGESRWIKKFASAVPVGSAILDLGCGSGQPIAADLIAAKHRITGVDSSPSLIAMAKCRYPDHSWIVEDMRRLNLGKRFGGVLAWHSLFHLTPNDQERMLSVFANHSSVGAVLMFTTGHKRGEIVGEWQNEPLYHASLGASDYASLLASNGFALVEHAETDPDCGNATIWLAQKIDGQ